jgi:hypothetical protein
MSKPEPAIVVNVQRPDVQIFIGGNRIDVMKPAEIFIVPPLGDVPVGCSSFELFGSGELVSVRLSKEIRRESKNDKDLQ